MRKCSYLVENFVIILYKPFGGYLQTCKTANGFLYKYMLIMLYGDYTAL